MLRRAHDHHRDLQARQHSALSADRPDTAYRIRYVMITDQVRTPYYPRCHARGVATRNARACSDIDRLLYRPRLSPSLERRRNYKTVLMIKIPASNPHRSSPIHIPLQQALLQIPIDA
jgi:hypothetical protein